ncbi:bifunctional [glutamine synthetase] adenylyltransferase/[glutamine synthetase]-adenylyl-L-tyrosine phosphorylase [Kordiimonas aestuarii]|uniref:bifunctional [glutamine synthetase] adenylyltransferase/[glutamine synthetase]-adenylyl-L-tyrosine phosphorylase n=1 Tax=Kordiimonas aestuarii TaxID=1005925 RepID=UPI0021D1C504|nr:bifunctional [glutamine synthetase] adenylyltransferase/[glutamine synthetase]-adenylyl-L-tyrosine phosphorylase [Kordiimonas aestuarii]
MAEKSQYPQAYDTDKADEIWACLCEYHQESQKSDEIIKLNKQLSSALFGNSPFLASIAKRKPETAIAALSRPPTKLFEALMTEMQAPRPDRETTNDLMAFLREKKSVLSLLSAVADVSGVWSLEEVTAALSRFADLSVEIALAHLLHTRMSAGDLAWPEDKPEPATPELSRKSGYFILGMGKLGAYELNYSSDIDLIALYDSDRASYSGNKSVGQCFIRLTQELVQIMEKRTMHGYVFRTDLRLRPDPGATPVAISIEAAESYYHSMAVNWERSAMIKARVIAGDKTAGQDYLDTMSRWVWRKSMDFVALRDIAAIKNQINRHYGQTNTVFEEYDVKLGQGGIREIEFFAQVNQLLYAGRHPGLRVRGTMDALDALATEQLIPAKTHKDLLDSYRFLRTLEHRIQMVDDAQTHHIPDQRDAIDRIACFMGFENRDALRASLHDHTERVGAHYDELLPEEQTSITSVGYGEADLPKKLEELGFAGIEAACSIIEGWRRGRYRALRTERAKALLEHILPGLMEAFSETHQPTAALNRFDKFISQLPAGVQLFSLLQANPSLFGLLARVMGLAPALAETLAKKPELWDAVLEPDFFAPMDHEEALASYLEELLESAADYQDTLDIVRRFVAEGRFRIGVQLLEALASVDECGEALTRFADVSLKALTKAAEQEFSQRHGRFDGGGIAVIAMGKYGGRELTSTSDLDMVFLYHVPDMDAVSDGIKPLSPSQYFSRLGQHIITAITALTPEGRLFEVDTRLRPSGQQGPLVVTLKTFADYYTDAAWTWEHMALTRARILIAPESVRGGLEDTILRVLTAPRDKTKLLKHVHDMRRKLDGEFGTENPWAVKNVRGGLIDMEFICQYLMLREGHGAPDIFSPELDASINRLGSIGALTAEQVDLMHKAHLFEQNIQSVLRLCLGSSRIKDDEIAEGIRRVLCRITATEDFNTLKTRLLTLQSSIYSLFCDVIEKPAEELSQDKDQ